VTQSPVYGHWIAVRRLCVSTDQTGCNEAAAFKPGCDVHQGQWHMVLTARDWSRILGVRDNIPLEGIWRAFTACLIPLALLRVPSLAA
jgi:hypothetical protein